MRTLRQHLQDRYPWLNLIDALAVIFVILVAITTLWPHSRLAMDLVVLTAIPGTVSAIAWGLTFWTRARVQIGRHGLRYKSVRRATGIATIACLPFLMVQQLSIYLSGPNVLRDATIDVTGLTEPYPKPERWEMRMVVAIAHLEGDDGHKIETQLRDALANLDGRLHVTPVILNRTIAVSGRLQGIAHLDALDAVTGLRVDSLIWGSVKGAGGAAAGPLYDTEFGDNPQFGLGYLPGDFRLPELPPDDLAQVLPLVVATDAAQTMSLFHIKFDDSLEPVVAKVRTIANDAGRTRRWTPDARARVNLILGIASRTSGVELKSKKSLEASVSNFQHALEGWTRERDPLDWAMTQRNLGSTYCDQYNLNRDNGLLHSALNAFENAISVFQSRSDQVDVAQIQSELGSLYEAIGRYEAAPENVRKAVDYYRAALNGIDPKKFPNVWSDTQIRLGNALRRLAAYDKGTRDLEDSIAANRAALKVCDKRISPICWAEAQGQVAQSLSELGYVTSNPEDLKQSIVLLRQVLDGYPRERQPVEWAQLKSCLGSALVWLYELDPNKGRQYPEEAVIAFRDGLQELTFEAEPLAWAEAKQGLGNALDDLGDINSDSQYLKQAIDVYDDSLRVFKRDQLPQQWAETKYDLGNALADLGQLGPGVKYLEQAVQNYREALAGLPKDSSSELRDNIQDALKITLEALNQRGSSES